MTVFLQIAVNVPGVAGVFDYHLPENLEAIVRPGHLVEVPFGRQHVQGVVIGIIDQPSVAETRPVTGLIDEHTALTKAQITLARQLAHDTLASLSDWVGLMLPPGIGKQADTLYTYEGGMPVGKRPPGALQQRLMALLRERGPLRGRQIDAALPRQNWRAASRSLIRSGQISTQAVLQPPSVGPKTVRTAQLSCSLEKAQASLPDLGRAGSDALKRRQAVLRCLMRQPGPLEVSWIYAESRGNLADLRKLSDMGLVILGENEIWRDPLEAYDVTLSQPPALTHDQQACLDEVLQSIQDVERGEAVKPLLLHGVTGSGKTEIYLRAVEAVLKRGKTAIALQPEIALTPQTVRRFMSRFPGQVGLIHSGLSDGERYDTWRRASGGSLKVIVGPRSALFTPLPDLGLIIVDECHDDSYYQGEPPFYHARETAISYASLAGAVCLLGSATPSVTSTYQAAQKRWRYLRLPQRILAHRQSVQVQVEKLGLTSKYRPYEGQADTQDLPPVDVIDMREELKTGNRSIFSRMLQDELVHCLENGQQAILFLNRRGTATYVFCRDCGNTLKCPQCDLPLTYHGANQALVCHHCGYRRKMPSACPSCKSRRIRQYGTGTEQVEADVQALLPDARTLRWDYETTRTKGAHDAILRHFSAHHADILIGTQMLAKGLDLPLVTLVGVVLADVGLGLPDYHAAERTFQVLTQVAGRAGRSPLGGKVVLLTFQPDHYVIRAAQTHNYRDFYRQELQYRKQLGYPPFVRLVRLEYRHDKAERAERAAHELAGQLQSWIQADVQRSIEIIGPVPCFYARLAGLYRWQIVLRGADPAALLRGRNLDDWRIEVNPPSLL